MVMVATDRMGFGDDELGLKLLANFIKTLNEMGSELWRLVFVNNGVKLTIGGSPVLEDLQGYEKEGLKILVCGTCLDHFKLLEKKQVGDTTNMLDIVTAMQLADEFAPEHLCLSVEEPSRWAERIRNAGGIFLGEHSFEVLGDYVAGPSHIMPTGGTARFSSPVNVLDFVKVINVIGLDPETTAQIGPAAARFARAESLTAHAAAAEHRGGDPT